MVLSDVQFSVSIHHKVFTLFLRKYFLLCDFDCFPFLFVFMFKNGLACLNWSLVLMNKMLPSVEVPTFLFRIPTDTNSFVFSLKL
jgi:hypothetical protein